MHPAHLQEYEQLVAGARKRKAGASEDSPSHKKLKQSSISGLLSGSNANMVSQAAVDESVFNFIIGSLQPLRVVEHPDFISLITTLHESPNTAQSCNRSSETDDTEAGDNFR